MPDDASLPKNLGGLNPAELLLRGMRVPQLSTAADGAAWVPPTVEEIARLLPQYEVIAMLGHGGMGAVYQARQTSLDRIVGIKVLPLEISGDRTFADGFVREARAMARLEHPNIIAVHDFGKTSEGHFYFMMDFVNGATLHDLIQAGKVTSAGALEVVEQVCDALSYAHAEGIVHCDIKPANVMVDQRGRVKVADFGLARLLDATAPEPGAPSMTGVVLGTPDYMAPEQKCGGKVDHRADVYALGVVLYEALCGEAPQGAFDLPSQRCGVSPVIDAIVTRALSQQPEKRFQSTGEMKAAIVAARTPVKLVPTPLPVNPSVPRATPPLMVAPEKKSRAPWIGIAAAVAVLAIGGALFFQKKSPPSKPPAPEIAVSTPVTSAPPPVEKPQTKAPEPEAKIAVAAPPVAIPAESTPAPEPAPAPNVPEATPPLKPQSEVERWLANIETQTETAFQKDVIEPYDTGANALRTNYQSAIDRGMNAASSAGKLPEAVAWRTEREKFLANGRNVSPDDSDSPIPPLKPLRASFRTQIARLEQSRDARAKAAFAKFDAIISPNITALTKRQRLDEALLLKTKLDETEQRWLAASPASTAPPPIAEKPPLLAMGATPAPYTTRKPATGEAALHAAVAWVIANGGTVRLTPSNKSIQKPEEIPPGEFAFDLVNLKLGPTPPTDADLHALTALARASYVTVEGWDLPDDSLAFLESFTNARQLSFRNCKQISDEALARLPALPYLTGLILDTCPAITGSGLVKLRAPKIENFHGNKAGLTDAGLASLTHFENLRDISLTNTAITDAGIIHLERLRELRRLDLLHTGVTPNGLAFLAKRKDFRLLHLHQPDEKDFEETTRDLGAKLPKLPGIELEGKGAGAATLHALLVFKELRVLHWAGSELSDADFAELQAIPTLEEIVCTGAELTDAAIDTILGMRGMQTLNLSHNEAITDAGILRLKGLKKLAKLNVAYTKVTPSGAAALERALAGCKVTR